MQFNVSKVPIVIFQIYLKKNKIKKELDYFIYFMLKINFKINLK